MNPIGRVTDFFYKVEFQMRGSPHIHMVAWIEDAPKLGEDNRIEVEEFIDKYVSCHKDQSIEDLIKFQTHSHGRTCRKRNKNKCRFQFPQPPMQSTSILYPLDADIQESEKKEHKDNWEKIRKKLDGMVQGKDITFDKFLEEINLSHEKYVLAVRSSVKTKTVFLKRCVNELRINNYNPTLLKCWRANMDLQFILDAYACVMYIVSYISKAQRGMSNLLYSATKEAKEENLNLRSQVKAIGNKFLTHVEVSAQEAVYYILQLPLRKSSREVIFINTSPEEERVVMLKSMQQIQSLPDESKDIQESNNIQRYINRPSSMENICLADFTSLYRATSTNLQKRTPEEQADDDEGYKGIKVRKRHIQAVIRCVGYHKENDSENYYRECLMLYHPWRVEKNIIGKRHTYCQQFEDVSNVSTILTKMKEYNHACPDIANAMNDLKNIQDEEIFEDQWDVLAPCTESTVKEDIAEGAQICSEYTSLPTNYVTGDSDINVCEVLTNLISDQEYASLTQSLNKEQKQFFYHVIHQFRTSKEPLYYFLSGGAGVGKTVVVQAIYQALVRLINKEPGSNPDNPKVLLAAPTGKAAFLIKGNTLHSLFQIPACQGFNYKPLKSDRLNSLRCKFQHVRLVIIDEISMVGNGMLHYIHRRLQQITGSEKVFGGISILAVGDLFQLKPVFDGWIYENLKEDYGPLASNLWKDNFSMFCLHKIMRQKECVEFANLLNRLREQKHTESDIKVLKERQLNRKEGDDDYPLLVPHIFLQNRRVEDFNKQLYMLSSEQKVHLKASDYIIGDVDSEIKENVRQSIPPDTNKTMGLAKELDLSLNIRCEISVNIDVEDGLSNGSSCVLKYASGFSKHSSEIDVLWVAFDDEDIGKKSRQEGKRLYTKDIDKSWTPIMRVKRSFMVGRYKSVQVVRQQFPLRCSAAKTCHRCQGDTMENAVVDFSGRCFPHCHYVALSRVKDLNNLYIKELNESKIHIDKRVALEMDRLSTSMRLVTRHEEVMKEDEDKFSIYYHNVRSFRKHWENVFSDIALFSPNLIVLVESKLSEQDEDEYYTLPGYQMNRFDNQEGCERSPYGIVVYNKSTNSLALHSHVISKHGKNMVESVIISIIDTELLSNELFIQVLYSSPKTSFGYLQQHINDTKKHLPPDCGRIVVGDFNIDLLSNSKHQIPKIMSPCQQYIKECTTEYNSLLDHVYSCGIKESIKCFVFESTYSDHFPILTSFSDE